MRVIENVVQMQEAAHKYKNKSVGFVPTMGALHLGHISLVKQASEENDIVVVSIFVNPTQFAKNEDLSTYPRKIEADIAICEKLGCDYLFLPNARQMYPNSDEVRILSPKHNGNILEGKGRNGHFDGVLQVVMKLFHLIAPSRAYFGKKDTQQVLLIEQMCAEYFLDVQIRRCETVRDENGLALSSRNVYLEDAQVSEALGISRALKTASLAVQRGESDCAKLIALMHEELGRSAVSYVQIVSPKLETLEVVEVGNTIIVITIVIGGKRYLDNVWI